jgi:glycerol-3-phosphate O-acyltransferase
MSASPWPEDQGRPLLFLLDAAHRVELKLLRDWLAEAAPPADAGFAEVALPISRRPEQVDSQPLVPMLHGPDELMIVPLRVVWLTSLDSKNTTPRFRDLLSGNPRRPGTWRAQRILTTNPDRARCIAGAGDTLGSLRKRLTDRLGEAPADQQLAEFVTGQAGLALDIAERSLQGRRYKVPRRVARNLSESPRFQDALKELSGETGTSMAALREESASIMKELIAIPGTFWLDVMGKLNHLVMSLGYESDMVVDREGLERIRRITGEHPSALLWTHKTHVDGFAVNSLFFDNDFPAPHILGGVNMAFAGLGFVGRRAGAIFIRRSFQDNPLYKIVLRLYIGYLLEKRFPLTWAFEGTRSRVGKLMPPRYGLLKYVVEAAHTTGATNLHIIPVAINYDLIGDVRDYAVEQSGTSKQPESLRWFIGYLRGLRQPLGRIYVDFGEPVVLAEAPSAEDPLELSKIAFQVGVEVNRVTPITLSALGAMVLLGAAPRALTVRELLRDIQRLVEWAKARNIRLVDTLVAENRRDMQQFADTMVDNGLLTRYDDGPERVYGIAAGQQAVAGYYRNTIIHFFVNKAIAELALLRQMESDTPSVAAFWAEAERLRDLFKFEFFYAPSDQFRDEIRDELGRAVPGWEEQLEQEGGAIALFRAIYPLVAHATLLPFVEAYRIVSDVVARQDDTEALEEKDCVAQSLAYGKQAYLQRRISSQSSIGKLLFQNGYKLMANQSLVDAGDAELGRRRRAMSRELRELQRRLERLRAMALPL